jgi:hypothetical protein
MGPASSPPQAARVEQAKTAVAQSKARRVRMVLPVIVTPLSMHTRGRRDVRARASNRRPYGKVPSRTH